MEDVAAGRHVDGELQRDLHELLVVLVVEVDVLPLHHLDVQHAARALALLHAVGEVTHEVLLVRRVIVVGVLRYEKVG